MGIVTGVTVPYRAPFGLHSHTDGEGGYLTFLRFPVAAARDWPISPFSDVVEPPSSHLNLELIQSRPRRDGPDSSANPGGIDSRDRVGAI